MFYERLRELMDSRQVTAEELASEVQAEPAELLGLQDGETVPEREILRRIAKLFSVNVDYLLGHNDLCRPVEKTDIRLSFSGSERLDLAQLTEEQMAYIDRMLERIRRDLNGD